MFTRLKIKIATSVLFIDSNPFQYSLCSLKCSFLNTLKREKWASDPFAYETRLQQSRPIDQKKKKKKKGKEKEEKKKEKDLTGTTTLA